MRLLRRWLLYVAVTTVLAACGGGGGGGFVPGADLNITEDNAVPVAAAVIGSFEAVRGLSDGGTGGIIGVAINTGGTGFDIPGFVMQQLERFDVIREQLLASNAVGVVAIDPPIEEPCDNVGLGYILITGNVEDPNSVNVGDYVVFTMHDCEVDGMFANGEFALTIAEFSGDIDTFLLPYDLTVDVVLSNFTVTEGTSTFAGDGDMRLRLAGGTNDGIMEMIMSGNSISVSEPGQTMTLSNYRYEITEQLLFEPFDYQIDMRGELDLDSPTLNGKVGFDTMCDDIDSCATFTGFADAFPEAGKMLVSGAGGSQCRLEPDPINPGEVVIEVDADGAGPLEATTINVPWDTLTM